MREIKFRAWDKDNKKLVLSSDITSMDLDDGYSSSVTYVGDGILGPLTLVQLCNFELMQYTGLLDKNGVEIYECDVVRSGNGRVWEIKHGHYKYLVPGVREKISIYGWYMEDNGCQLSLFDGGEVIGNKFENPELLKDA